MFAHDHSAKKQSELERLGFLAVEVRLYHTKPRTYPSY